jgi:hypothetical protein
VTLNTSTTNSNPQTWIPPQQNVIKTNTVAAFAEVKTGSGSVIARSDSGVMFCIKRYRKRQQSA